MNSTLASCFRLIDRGLLAILLLYGLVAILMTAGTTLDLPIVPTVLLGVLCLAAIVWWGGNREFSGLEAVGADEWKMLWAILAFGAIVRVAFGLTFQFPFFSDFDVYFKSAVHLLNVGEYRVPEPEGMLKVYRAPGTTFVLAGTMLITGIVHWAPVVLNTCCFIATGWLLWMTLRPRLTLRAVAGAVGMFAIWPSGIMFTGIPQSESPTMLFIAALLYLLSIRKGRPLYWATATAVVTGMVCLIRNTNLILIPLWMLVAWREEEPLAVRIRAIFIVAIVTFLPILPWTYRNYKVMGVPILVAANAGENLYSANNDNTSGSWDDKSTQEVRVYLPDELKMDRIAGDKAKEWIRSHPVQFLRLSVNKLRLFMSSDSQGAYYVFERGLGYKGPGLLAANIAANLWWLVLWGLVLTAVRYHRRFGSDATFYAFAGIGTIPALVFFVFQSQPRYHMPMVPVLLAIAGYGLAMQRKKAS